MEEAPADHPPIVDRLAVRPDNPTSHRDPTPERDADFLLADARLQVQPDVGMRIEPPATGMAIDNHPAADLLEDVIVIGGHDGEIARAGEGPESKRAIGSGVKDGAPAPQGGVELPLLERDEADRRARDRFAGSFLGDCTVDQNAARQGQVQRLLDRALGPVEAMTRGQVGFTRGGIGQDEIDIAG